jgi:flagellar basal body-associated protein FliL
MTTKKLFIIIGSIVAAFILLIVIFVGAIIGITFYSISKSEAATTAKTFLKTNEKLKQDIGEVKDFGAFITGSINTQNTDGAATLSLKVIGERRTINANVSLMYRDNRAWRVTDASYQNEQGQTIKLLDPYEPVAPEP